MRKSTRRNFSTRGAVLAGLAGAFRLISISLKTLSAQVSPADKPSGYGTRLRNLLEKIFASGSYYRAQASWLTAARFAEEQARAEDLIGQLNAIDCSRLTNESIDLRDAESILWGGQICQTLPNPDTELEQQVSESLKSSPALFANGQTNIKYWILRIRELIIFMVDKEISIYRDAVPTFAAWMPGVKADTLITKNKVMASVLDYQRFVRVGLPNKQVAGLAIGSEAYQNIRGKKFIDSEFCERLLNVGCMPPNLVREGHLNSLV
jgi:hypothetical protein